MGMAVCWFPCFSLGPNFNFLGGNVLRSGVFTKNAVDDSTSVEPNSQGICGLRKKYVHEKLQQHYISCIYL